MFSNCPFALLYAQADARLGTIFNLALPDTIKDNLYMMSRDRTFKFDESTNRSVNKLYDEYIQY